MMKPKKKPCQRIGYKNQLQYFETKQMNNVIYSMMITNKYLHMQISKNKKKINHFVYVFSSSFC